MSYSHDGEGDAQSEQELDPQGECGFRDVGRKGQEVYESFDRHASMPHELEEI